jgi:catechol 2,3-dioxygenase-like lactoylglutathione lyase family enzyme
MLFERVDRVVSLVRNLDKAKAFFSDLLDISFDETITDKEIGVKVTHAGRFGLELVSPIPTEHPMGQAEQRFLDENGECLRFIVIKVADLDQAVQRFRDQWIEPMGMNTVGKGKEAFYNPADTFGVPIVLNEYPDPHPMTGEAIAAGRNSP